MVTSGHGFDGGPGRDFAEFLRRELHAAADQVEPGADGLERIRDKIRSRPGRASRPKGALGVWLAISGFLAGLGARLAALRGGTAGEGDARRKPKRPMDWREAMLRPAFAVGVAVFAIGVVLAAVPPARQAMVQVGNDIGSAFNSSSSSPTTDGQGSTLAPTTIEGSQASNPGVIAHSTPSSCPSSSAHPSDSPTTTGSTSSTTEKTTAPATSSSGNQSGGSTTSSSASASPSASTSSPSRTASPTDTPSGTPTPKVTPSPSPTSDGTIKPSPSSTCTSEAPTQTASSSPSATTSATPKTSASSSASQSASSKSSSSAGSDAITPNTRSTPGGSGTGSGEQPTSSSGP